MAASSFGKTIILGTRGSELALTQARMVARQLQEKCGIEARIEIVRTKGDVIPSGAEGSRRESFMVTQRDPLTALRSARDDGGGRKGIFTAELERALLEERIDVAVHSAKDLPSEMEKSLAIAATLKRASVEDLLVRRIEASLAQLPPGAKIATGSVRRQRQLCWQRNDLELVDLRGNVPTRLRKFVASDWDGIVLARAGLERLGFLPPAFEFDGQKLFVAILSPDVFVPAGGQGIIALQTRAENSAQFEALDDGETHLCLRAEREFLRLLQGDCELPVGAHARFVGEDEIELHAQLFGNDREPKMTRARGREPEKLADEVFQKLDQEHE